MGWTRFTNGGCPVCEGTRRDCRQNSESQLIHCRADYASPRFRLVGQDRLGFNMYALDDDQEQRPKRPKRERRETKEQKRNPLTLEERDKQNRILLSLKLDKADYKDLLRRKLTGAQIRQGMFSSIHHGQALPEGLSRQIPGVSATGPKVWVGASGMLCPIWQDGRIVAFQIKGDPKFAKYLWPATKDSNKVTIVTSKLQNGESPLTFLQIKRSKRIGLCEGILKPYIAHKRLGLNIIGAAGGLFTSSPEQLKAMLDRHFGNVKDRTVEFYPDKAGLKNPNVARNNRKTIKLLMSWGYRVLVLNWGQLHSSNGKADIDEIDIKTYKKAERLSGDQFLKTLSRDEWYLKHALPLKVQGAVARVLRYEPKAPRTMNLEVESDAKTIYSPGCLPTYDPDNPKSYPKWMIREKHREVFYREANLKGWPLVFDSSGTGSGKTYAVGTLTPDYLFDAPQQNPHRIFYLVKSSRNANTLGIQENYTELATRHSGFYFDLKKKNPDGTPQRFRATKDRPADTEANCHWSDQYAILSKKGHYQNLCDKCPLQEQCRTSVGPGYGYMLQSKTSLQSSLIRANPMGLKPQMLHADRDAAIIDEATQTLDPFHEIIFGYDDIVRTRSDISEIDHTLFTDINPLLDTLQKVCTGESPTEYYGTDTLASFQKLGLLPDNIDQIKRRVKAIYDEVEERTIDLIDSESVKHLEYLVSQKWLPNLLAIWSGETNGAINFRKRKIILTQRNHRVLNTLKEFKFIVLQDATCTARDIAWLLQREKTDILHCEQAPPKKSNLTIMHITGLGSLGNSGRGNYTTPRVKAIRDALNLVHGDDIGFIDWSQYRDKKAGDLAHFSDARGSNQFQHKQAVCSFGIPVASLGATQAAYEIFTGKRISLADEDPGFEQYKNEKVMAEILQEIGRLRANRRTDDVTFYLCGDVDLTHLKNLGYNVVEVPDFEISLKATSRETRNKWVVYQTMGTLKRENQEVSQRKIVKQSSRLFPNEKINKTSIVSLAKSFAGGWSEFLEVLDWLIDPKDTDDEAIIEKAKSYLPEMNDYLSEPLPKVLSEQESSYDIVEGSSLDYRQRLLKQILNVCPDHWLNTLQSINV